MNTTEYHFIKISHSVSFLLSFNNNKILSLIFVPHQILSRAAACCIDKKQILTTIKFPVKWWPYACISAHTPSMNSWCSGTHLKHTHKLPVQKKFICLYNQHTAISSNQQGNIIQCYKQFLLPLTFTLITHQGGCNSFYMKQVEYIFIPMIYDLSKGTPYI